MCQGSSAGLERWSHKPEVGGSSPPLDTNLLFPNLYSYNSYFIFIQKNIDFTKVSHQAKPKSLSQRIISLKPCVLTLHLWCKTIQKQHR